MRARCGSPDMGMTTNDREEQEIWADFGNEGSKAKNDKGLRATSQGWDQLRTTLQSTVSNQE